MKSFYVLADALNYIEENLCEPIMQEDIADACYASLSSVQKLFRYAFLHSIKEYITKRRLTHAAYDLVHTDMIITEIAMKYQYNSPEVFCRAFSKLWGTTPSTYKSKWKFTGIFPKLIFEGEGDHVMTRKKVDVSELYDVLKAFKDAYVLCFDIVGLMPINNIGYEAGDKAILTCLKRIDDQTNADMILFRIGGDEFAVVSGITEKKEVEDFTKRVLNSNGEGITYNGQEIPLSMRVCAARVDCKNLRYNEVLNRLQHSLETMRDNNLSVLILE